MADVVHKSAHPSLPPAAPEQVVQYLLAKNFHLTALELLVEAQQAGHGDDVRDLEAFFSDRDRFPPEELARYQPDNAFDLQAAGKERESRLQLAEYELRLAKEDLAEMARKLAQAQERQQQQQQQLQQAASLPGPAGAAAGSAAGPGAGMTGSGPSPFSSSAAGLLPAGSTSSCPGPAALLGPPGAGPTPEEKRALNVAVFAHLLRQGLVTTAMTLEEEYGGSLRPVSASPGGAAVTHGSSDAEHPWELWSWYQAAAAAAARNAASEESHAAGAAAGSDAAVSGTAVSGAAALAAAAPSPPPQPQAGSGATSAAVAEAALAAAAAAVVDPEDIIRQFSLASDPGLDLDLDGTSDAGASTAGSELQATAAERDEGSGSGDDKQLRAQLRAVREELAATRARARAAVVAATAAAEAAAAAAAAASATAAVSVAVQQQQQQLRSAPLSRQSPVQQPMSYISADANVLELLDLGPPATSSGHQAAVSTPAAAKDPLAAGSAAEESQGDRAAAGAGRGSGTAALDDEAREDSTGGAAARTDAAKEPPWRRIDPAYHSSLEVMLSGLCDMMPRLVPNLNIKSRLEVLPLIVTAARTTSDWEARRQLLVAVFNLAPAPDHQQRQAIIDACLEMCQAFGAGWAATELLQLCCRQASSPSSERRTLVAETLGEAVGTVDPGTQAHVLLTQLSQLAKDRMDQVREAACHSLARLVPRLPFTRSYYSTLEGLLLPLATDASEAVHIAAMSYLVPALLTWQPQDTDSVLVSSCLARVLSEISQQVRIIEQYQQAFFQHQYQLQQQQQQLSQPQGKGDAAAAIPAAAAGNNSISGGFTGTFLRYGHAAAPSSPAPAAPPPPSSPTPPAAAAAAHQQQQQPSSEGQLGSRTSKGSTTSLSELAGGGPGSAPSPSSATVASPPPPPQWVSFGRRSFPSASHLLLYQLLALYGGLTPALRHAALRSRPDWAAPTGSSTTAGSTAGSAAPPGASHTSKPSAAAGGPPEAADASSSRRHHQRVGSLDAPSLVAASAAAGATAPDVVPAVRQPSSDTAGATHRRTSSHPVFGGFGPLGGAGGADGSGTASSGTLPPRASLQHAHLTPLYQMLMPKCSSSGALANGVDGAPGAAGSAEGQTGSAGGAEEDRGGPEWARADEGAKEGADVLEDQERAEEDASLAAWATHGSHSSWKTLEWLMQHVVPELIRLVCCVGPMFAEALDVRRQAACAVAATCSVMGAPFTQAAMEPVFLVASGAGASTAAAAGGSAGGGGGAAAAAVINADLDAPIAVRDLCVALQPRTLEALRMARQCVLPVLLVSVLPAARRLRPYLLQLMESAHELRQRWLMEALPDYTTALTFACSQRADLLPQVLHVLEDLLSGASASGSAPAQALQNNHAGNGNGGGAAAAASADAKAGSAAAAGPASTHVGLCCAALARALVPLASLELASRRLLPGLMALMSYGEPELQRACVGVLAELGLRFRGDGPRVSEQVLAVYDSLLEQGGHGVQLEVLAAGTALAAAAAPSAAVSAAAAAQVEWLLTAVQVVAARLTAPVASGAAGAQGGGALTVDHQRALAAQLLAALRPVAPYDLRLPRLQANFNSALDAIQRCKALLPDPQQQAALSALLKERSTGQSAAGASVSSTTPSAAAAVAAAAASSSPLWTGPSSSLPAVPAYASPSVPGLAHNFAGLASTPTQSAAGGANPFLPQAGATPATHGTPDGAQAGTSGQLRSRFDAFRQRLMKRKDDAASVASAGQTGTAAGAAAAAAAGAKPKESFFSDDEGE